MTQINLRHYHQNIRQFLEDGQPERAVGACRQILKQYPRHLETYRLMGESLMALNSTTEAADLFKRVLSSDPNDLIAHVALSEIYKDQHQKKEALWHIERAAELQPHDWAITQERLNAYQMNELDLPNPDDLTAVGAVRIQIRSGLYPQALQLVGQLLAAYPNRLDLSITKADLYWRMGLFDEAYESARQILHKLPNSLVGHAILADVHRRRSQDIDAAAHYSELQALLLINQQTLREMPPEHRPLGVQVLHAVQDRFVPEQFAVQSLSLEEEKELSLTGTWSLPGGTTPEIESFPDMDAPKEESSFDLILDTMTSESAPAADLFDELDEGLNELDEASASTASEFDESFDAIDDSPIKIHSGLLSSFMVDDRPELFEDESTDQAEPAFFEEEAAEEEMPDWLNESPEFETLSPPNENEEDGDWLAFDEELDDPLGETQKPDWLKATEQSLTPDEEPSMADALFDDWSEDPLGLSLEDDPYVLSEPERTEPAESEPSEAPADPLFDDDFGGFSLADALNQPADDPISEEVEPDALPTEEGLPDLSDVLFDIDVPASAERIDPPAEESEIDAALSLTDWLTSEDDAAEAPQDEPFAFEATSEAPFEEQIEFEPLHESLDLLDEAEVAPETQLEPPEEQSVTDWLIEMQDETPAPLDEVEAQQAEETLNAILEDADDLYTEPTSAGSEAEGGEDSLTGWLRDLMDSPLSDEESESDDESGVGRFDPIPVPEPIERDLPERSLTNWLRDAGDFDEGDFLAQVEETDEEPLIQLDPEPIEESPVAETPAQEPEPEPEADPPMPEPTGFTGWLTDLALGPPDNADDEGKIDRPAGPVTSWLRNLPREEDPLTQLEEATTLPEPLFPDTGMLDAQFFKQELDDTGDDSDDDDDESDLPAWLIELESDGFEDDDDGAETADEFPAPAAETNLEAAMDNQDTVAWLNELGFGDEPEGEEALFGTPEETVEAEVASAEVPDLLDEPLDWLPNLETEGIDEISGDAPEVDESLNELHSTTPESIDFADALQIPETSEPSLTESDSFESDLLGFDFLDEATEGEAVETSDAFDALFGSEESASDDPGQGGLTSWLEAYIAPIEEGEGEEPPLEEEPDSFDFLSIDAALFDEDVVGPTLGDAEADSIADIPEASADAPDDLELPELKDVLPESVTDEAVSDEIVTAELTPDMLEAVEPATEFDFDFLETDGADIDRQSGVVDDSPIDLSWLDEDAPAALNLAVEAEEPPVIDEREEAPADALEWLFENDASAPNSLEDLLAEEHPAEAEPPADDAVDLSWLEDLSEQDDPPAETIVEEKPALETGLTHDTEGDRSEIFDSMTTESGLPKWLVDATEEQDIAEFNEKKELFEAWLDDPEAPQEEDEDDDPDNQVTRQSQFWMRDELAPAESETDPSEVDANQLMTDPLFDEEFDLLEDDEDRDEDTSETWLELFAEDLPTQTEPEPDLTDLLEEDSSVLPEAIPDRVAQPAIGDDEIEEMSSLMDPLFSGDNTLENDLAMLEAWALRDIEAARQRAADPSGEREEGESGLSWIDQIEEPGMPPIPSASDSSSFPDFPTVDWNAPAPPSDQDPFIGGVGDSQPIAPPAKEADDAQSDPFDFDLGLGELDEPSADLFGLDDGEAPAERPADPEIDLSDNDLAGIADLFGVADDDAAEDLSSAVPESGVVEDLPDDPDLFLSWLESETPGGLSDGGDAVDQLPELPSVLTDDIGPDLFGDGGMIDTPEGVMTAEEALDKGITFSDIAPIPVEKADAPEVTPPQPEAEAPSKPKSTSDDEDFSVSAEELAFAAEHGQELDGFDLGDIDDPESLLTWLDMDTSAVTDAPAVDEPAAAFEDVAPTLMDDPAPPTVPSTPAKPKSSGDAEDFSVSADELAFAAEHGEEIDGFDFLDSDDPETLLSWLNLDSGSGADAAPATDPSIETLPPDEPEIAPPVQAEPEETPPAPTQSRSSASVDEDFSVSAEELAQAAASGQEIEGFEFDFGDDDDPESLLSWLNLDSGTGSDAAPAADPSIETLPPDEPEISPPIQVEPEETPPAPAQSRSGTSGEEDFSVSAEELAQAAASGQEIEGFDFGFGDDDDPESLLAWLNLDSDASTLTEEEGAPETEIPEEPAAPEEEDDDPFDDGLADLFENSDPPGESTQNILTFPDQPLSTGGEDFDLDLLDNLLSGDDDGGSFGDDEDDWFANLQSAAEQVDQEEKANIVGTAPEVEAPAEPEPDGIVRNDLGDLPDDPDAAIAMLKQLADEQNEPELDDEALGLPFEPFEDEGELESLDDILFGEEQMTPLSTDELTKPPTPEEFPTIIVNVDDNLPNWLEEASPQGDSGLIDWLESEINTNELDWLAEEEAATIQARDPNKPTTGRLPTLDEILGGPEDSDWGASEPSQPLVVPDLEVKSPIEDTQPIMLPLQSDFEIPQTGDLEESATDTIIDDPSEKKETGPLFDDIQQAVSSGNLDDAIATYRQILDSGKSTGALIISLEDAAENNKRNPELQRLLGDAYMKSGMLQQALEAYRKAQDLL